MLRQKRLAIDKINAINDARLAANRGQFDDDVAFMRALNAAEEGMEIEDAFGDYYDLMYNEKNPEKILMKKKANRVQPTSPDTLRSKALASIAHLIDSPLVAVQPDNTARLRALMAQNIDDAAIKQIGVGGIRKDDKKGLSMDFLLDRAAVLAGDLDRGFNRKTGAPFMGLPLDAGHIVAHAVDPTKSILPSNIMYENASMNRGKSSVEKLAANEQRMPTEGEFAAALIRSAAKNIKDAESSQALLNLMGVL